jgi:hypothetical protein
MLYCCIVSLYSNIVFKLGNEKKKENKDEVIKKMKRYKKKDEVIKK